MSDTKQGMHNLLVKPFKSEGKLATLLQMKDEHNDSKT